MYPGLSHGAYECLHAHGTTEQKALYLPKLVVGRLDRHHVPDRAALRHRPRHAAHRRPSRRPTAPTRSPAARSSSRPASTTWPRTSSTWCWRACPTRRPAPRASRCSSCRSSCRTPTARSASATASTAARIEHKMGIHGNATCQMNLDGATGWLVGEPNKGLNAMFVMMNAARLGVGMQSLGLTEVAYQNARGLREGPPADALAVGPEGAGQAGRPDHRAPRRAPHAADREGLCRRRPRVRVLRRAADRPANCITRTKTCARKPPTWSRC